MSDALLPAKRIEELLRNFQSELVANILPFWMTRVVDETRGGFYGALTNDLKVHNEEPRSATLYGRILWTFSRAYGLFHDESYLLTAKRAYDYILRYFWDAEYGGVYWSVDAHGKPIEDRKHSYAQAFVLYGLSEYHRATANAESLNRAQELFHLLETHAYDAKNGGYIEGCDRKWQTLRDMRLSAREPHCDKSMNTMLHVMEAYTNLMRVANDAELKVKQKKLIEVLLDHVVDTKEHRFRLFFDNAWRVLPDHISPGHDIEGSWLLVEAAKTLGDQDLLQRATTVAVNMADRVYKNGRDSDGTLVYEQGEHGTLHDRHWWVQSEAVVGFFNVYQITAREEFARAALKIWEYIDDHFVDRAHGEWFKILHRDGTPYVDRYKTGPWECPYHNSRMCFEMLQRLREVRGEP